MNNFDAFTEAGFRAILQQIKSAKYKFRLFSGGDCSALERHVIWRHDVDFSMHRAAKLAKIELEEGRSRHISSTLEPHIITCSSPKSQRSCG